MTRIVDIALLLAVTLPAVAQQTSAPPTVSIDWSHTAGVTRTTITLQVVENPPLRRGSPIHDAAWANLEALHTDETRLALWYPYPRLAVAELTRPTATSTSWNFSDIDPIVDDFFRATAGHSSVFTMSTLPAWVYCDVSPAALPASPDEAVWSYEAGSRLCDPSGKEVAAYFGRVAGWYTRGGFRDELGLFHASSHHDRIAWWEVLNEPEYEHALDIRSYTHLYDRVAAAVHAVSPQTRFVGMSLAEPMRSPGAFEYFLNPIHHAPHTPLDAVSFHFYADAQAGETPIVQSYTFFDRADAFLNSVRYIDAIRQRLSPNTQLHVNEAGCIDASDLHLEDLPPPSMDSPYWNLCGAVFAYLYAGLSAEHIDVLGASQLLGYPSQFPSVSLLDWNSGAPTARYRVLQLLHETLGPGNRIVPASSPMASLRLAAFMANGHRVLLLVNKRAVTTELRLPTWRGAAESHIDILTHNAISSSNLDGPRLILNGFSVMIIQWSSSPASSQGAGAQLYYESR